MYKKLSWAFLALGALFLLGSCGGMFGGGADINGSKIYVMSARQMPGQPGKFEITVDLDLDAYNAQKAELKDAYYTRRTPFISGWPSRRAAAILGTRDSSNPSPRSPWISPR
jgi:hypothetical protein